MQGSIKETIPFPIKGVMIDFARLTEDFSYYVELIPLLKQWGFNYLFAHITDDEGCAVKLNTVQVIHTAGALTREEWSRLINTANLAGITVIPEVESLGHTGYITRQEKYKNLREAPEDGKRFWSISPCRDESVSVVTGIIDEIDQIFNAPFIHIGMDEADIGGSITSREMLKTKPKWKIFGEYLEKINHHVKALGKRTMIWGDHLLQSSELAEYISKDVVICNWLYGKGHSMDYYNLTKYFSDRGFDYVGCSAAVWRGTLFAPHRSNIENIRDFHKTMQLFTGESNLGSVVTLWTPYRYLPGIPLSLLYYAGRRFNGNHADENWVTDYTNNQFAPEQGSAIRIANAIKAILYCRSYSLIEEILLPYNLETLSEVNKPVVLALASNYDYVASDSLKILLEESGNITKGESVYNQWITTVDIIHRIASFAEQYQLICSHLFQDSSIRHKSPNIIIKHLLEDMNKLYDLWMESNLKYRNNYMQEETEDLSVSELFWKKENGDHPSERLRLTMDFLEKMAG